MRKKKNCNGCAALDENGCELGYKADIRRDRLYANGVATSLTILRGTPLDICPKPMTITKLCKLHLLKSRS